MAVSGAARGEPSAHVLRSIASASQRTGIPFGYLFNQAKAESAFNPTAKATTSSAVGLYQFTRQTWLATLDAHGAEHGLSWAADAIEQGPGGRFRVRDPQARDGILELRNDPNIAAAMAGELASDNGAYLREHLGREATQTDLALAHFLGAGGAANFLTALVASPEAPAASLFPDAAAANRSVFYHRTGEARSFAEIHARFAAQANANPGSPVNAVRQPATGPVRRVYRAEEQSIAGARELRGFEPMPGSLSLSFAQSAYRRLAGMGGGA